MPMAAEKPVTKNPETPLVSCYYLGSILRSLSRLPHIRVAMYPWP
jgi:hypothetical protein